MSRDKILNSIKKNINFKVDKEIDYIPVKFKNRIETFVNSLTSAGGYVTDTLNGFDVILEAKFGIAENGACFVNNQIDRKVYTYYESIVIKLEKIKIVNNMEEAMKLIEVDDFGIFLCGPSKTADIEQSLVIGAHGARKMAVFLY